MPRPQPGTWAADPAHFARQSRRDLIRVGVLGGLGLTLGDVLRLEAAEPAGKKPEAKAKSVIHVYLQGGFPHMDSFSTRSPTPRPSTAAS